jgi:hypothetical protein
MSHVYSEKQLDHYLAIMDRVAELWLQKFPERAAYSPGYWHLFMGLYKNRKQAITKGEAAEFLNAAQIKSPATRAEPSNLAMSASKRAKWIRGPIW